MPFAIKAEIHDPRAKTFSFNAQKTMYGGKHIAKGETVFVFASENAFARGSGISALIANAMIPLSRRSSGIGPHAIASRCRARINSSSMMAMLNAFHASPLANAAV